MFDIEQRKPGLYGLMLYEPGERIQHVYFPNDAHVLLLAPAGSRCQGNARDGIAVAGPPAQVVRCHR
jgi:hypothetical protein